MLLLNQLKPRHKILLAEMLAQSKLTNTEISADTLGSLKRGVLEYAFEILRPNLSARKAKLIELILAKIVYIDVVETELLVPKERRMENENKTIQT